MEKAKLSDLMESSIPKVDSYLPASQFDEFYRSMNPKGRETWLVGNAVAAIIFRQEGSLVRIYRGDPRDPNQWGVLQRRMALGEMGIDAIANNPLGNGVLAQEMVSDLNPEKVSIVPSEWGAPESPVPAAIDCTNDVRQIENMRRNLPRVAKRAVPKRVAVKKKSRVVSKKSKTRTRRQAT